MKVHVLGFSWDTRPILPADEFFAHLAQVGRVPRPFNGYDRLLYTGHRDGYFVGLFLTIKRQSKVCEIEKTGAEYKVNVRHLKRGTNPVDFNFFALNNEEPSWSVPIPPSFL
jgi:hypothetical protein